eukprot:10148742-Karenia_brevis.AAC.1
MTTRLLELGALIESTQNQQSAAMQQHDARVALAEQHLQSLKEARATEIQAWDAKLQEFQSLSNKLEEDLRQWRASEATAP